MSDEMLHGVLNFPPEMWNNTELDIRQRHARYVEASRRIEADWREINRLRAQITALEAKAIGEGRNIEFLRNTLEWVQHRSRSLADAQLVAKEMLRTLAGASDRLPPQG